MVQDLRWRMIELGKLSEVSAFLESADAHPTAVYHCLSAAL
jgi:hypothetical protein